MWDHFNFDHYFCNCKTSSHLEGIVCDWCTRRDTSKIKFDRNIEPYIKGPAAKDGVITWIKLVNDEGTFEVKS